MCVVELMT